MQLMQCILEFGILAELFIIMCLLAVIWQQICEKKEYIHKGDSGTKELRCKSRRYGIGSERRS